MYTIEGAQRDITLEIEYEYVECPGTKWAPPVKEVNINSIKDAHTNREHSTEVIARHQQMFWRKKTTAQDIELKLQEHLLAQEDSMTASRIANKVDSLIKTRKEQNQ